MILHHSAKTACRGKIWFSSYGPKRVDQSDGLNPPSPCHYGRNRSPKYEMAKYEMHQIEMIKRCFSIQTFFQNYFLIFFLNFFFKFFFFNFFNKNKNNKNKNKNNKNKNKNKIVRVHFHFVNIFLWPSP